MSIKKSLEREMLTLRSSIGVSGTCTTTTGIGSTAYTSKYHRFRSLLYPAQRGRLSPLLHYKVLPLLTYQDCQQRDHLERIRRDSNKPGFVCRSYDAPQHA